MDKAFLVPRESKKYTNLPYRDFPTQNFGYSEPMPRRALWILPLIASSCHPPKTQSDIDAIPIGTYQVNKSRDLSLEVRTPLSDTTLEIEANMNMAGMTPIHGVAHKISKNLYRAKDFKFDMSGEWILTIKATNKGKTLSSELKLQVK